MKVGILGSGAWARALATLAAEAGHSPAVGYRERPPGGFKGSPNLAGVVAESDVTLLALPTDQVREVVQEARPGPESRLVIASRGLELQRGEWISDVITSNSACVRVGALAGPAVAAEVLSGRPTALVVASAFDEVADHTQRAIHSPLCRIYTSSDLRGVELAGAIVEPLAAAVGIATALELGIGIRGVVVTRGIAEAQRLGQALGADERTFAGLAGIGDLTVCSLADDHPGFQAGLRVGRGERASDRYLAKAQAVLDLGKGVGVELPLVGMIAAIGAGKVEPRIAIDMLMRRPSTKE